MIKYSILLLFLATCNADGNVTSVCSQRERISTYLDVAVDMIMKAKNNFPTSDFSGVNYGNNSTQQIMDCAGIFRMGHNKSGIYKVWPMNRLTVDESLDVYCDMETDGGGWTLIQRRGDYKMPNDSFYKDWKSYKEGFGDIKTEFWLGNDNIFALTNQKLYSVRFDLQDVENNNRYAHYDMFWIDDEYNNYTLHISNYTGNAGDSMDYHNNMKFTTKDKQNDNSRSGNCAERRKGAWWYNNCSASNLNGLYLKGKLKTSDIGVNWNAFKGTMESLLTTEIKIRPKNFKQSSDFSATTPMRRKKEISNVNT